MIQTPSKIPAALVVARSLMESHAAHPGEKDPGAVAIGLQRTCAEVVQSLSDSIGSDGCNALLARGLAQAEVAHPVLKGLGRFIAGKTRLDGMDALIATHGVETVTAAVEAMLAAIVEVLSRLIGEDMAIRLMYNGPVGTQRTEGNKS